MLVFLGDKFLGVSLHSAKTLKKKQRGVKGVVFNVQLAPSQSCALRTCVGFRVNEHVHFVGVGGVGGGFVLISVTE